MKKIALVLFLLLNLCLPAYAANFVEIHSDDDGKIYIDVDSVTLRKSGNHEYVVAWAKYIPAGDWSTELYYYYKTDIDHINSFDAYNKNAKQIQELSLYYYDKKDTIIDQTTQSFQIAEYEEVIPDSNADITYDFVMNYYNKNKK